jgi:hypothetical protein
MRYDKGIRSKAPSWVRAAVVAAASFSHHTLSGGAFQCACV